MSATFSGAFAIGASIPARGTAASDCVCPPVESVTLTAGSVDRPSDAPTASHEAADAGVATVPKRAPVGPSLPAAAMTSAPALAAPSAASASGVSPNAANGSETGATITCAWSERSPSPFGSSARSMPASSEDVEPTSTPRSIAMTWIGRIFAPGATPPSPAGPPAPAMMPAM